MQRPKLRTAYNTYTYIHTHTCTRTTTTAACNSSLRQAPEEASPAITPRKLLQATVYGLQQSASWRGGWLCSFFFAAAAGPLTLFNNTHSLSLAYHHHPDAAKPWALKVAYNSVGRAALLPVVVSACCWLGVERLCGGLAVVLQGLDLGPGGTRLFTRKDRPNVFTRPREFSCDYTAKRSRDFGGLSAFPRKLRQESSAIQP